MSFEIPAWEHDKYIETVWGELVELKYGKSLKDYKDASGKYPVYGTNGAIGYCDKPLCEFSSVIVGRKGAYRGIHYSDKPFYVIDTAYFVVPKYDINLKWVYYALLTADINGLDSGSAIPSTRREDFYAMTAKVPPRSEQEEIVRNLDCLNLKIELNRQTNQTLEQIALALFKSWFVDFEPVKAKIAAKQAGANAEQIEQAAICAISGKPPEQLAQLNPQILQQLKTTAALFPDALVDSELGEIPEGWGMSTLGKHFNVVMGQSPSGETYNEISEGIVFFQGRRDFGFRYPTARVYTTDPKRFAQAGDTLISVRAPVGDKNMALHKCCIGRGVAAIRHKSGSRSFTYVFISYIESNLSNSGSDGTVFSSISKDELNAVAFAAPSYLLVKRFEELMYPIEQKIEVLSKEIEAIKKTRDALLPKLLSGEIDLSNMNATTLFNRVVGTGRDLSLRLNSPNVE